VINCNAYAVISKPFGTHVSFKVGTSTGIDLTEFTCRVAIKKTVNDNALLDEYHTLRTEDNKSFIVNITPVKIKESLEEGQQYNIYIQLANTETNEEYEVSRIYQSTSSAFN
jgi:hypothetical protein